MPPSVQPLQRCKHIELVGSFFLNTVLVRPLTLKYAFQEANSGILISVSINVCMQNYFRGLLDNER